MSNSNSDKKFNETIAAFWKKKSGNLMTMSVDAKMFEQLQKVEIGSKLFLKVVDPSKKKESRHPDAYLEILDKDSVAAFEAAREQQADSGL